MHLACALPVLLAIALPPGAAPHVSPPQDALPEARAVIDRFLSVTKLGERLESTRVRHDVGRVQLMGIEGKTESWSLRSGFQVVDMELGGFGKITSGCDGTHAWVALEMTGPIVLKDTDLLQARLEASYDAPRRPDAWFESLRTVGRESFEGKDCYAVELVLRAPEGMDPASTRLARTLVDYYEVESGLLLGQSGHQEGELTSGPFRRVFSDYRDFSGVWLPAKTRQIQASQEVVTLIDSVEFDPEGAPELAIPPDVRRLLEPQAAQPPAGG
jgi:hypothetical protein